MKLTIGIIGLGYVGIELATNIKKKNFNVYLFDKDLHKINQLKKGISPLNIFTNKEIKILSKDNIFHTNQIHKVSLCDIIIFCLPTPLKKNNKPDMSFLKSSFSDIYKHLRKNQLIINESTVYPGATREIFEKKLNKKFKLGKNFYLSFSPERVSPGKTYLIKFTNVPKILSGYSKRCLNYANKFYSKIFTNIYKSSSLEEAEFIKLYENTFRLVNISLVNSLKILSDKLKLKVFKIIDGARTKPYGFIPFSPSPGIGGHCIPIDPMFLYWKGEKLNLKNKLIKSAFDINEQTINWTLKKIKKITNPNNKLLFLGISYKKDVDDIRESASLKIFMKLRKTYKSVDYHDPLVPKLITKKEKINSIKKINKKILSYYDFIILGVDHSSFKYNMIFKFSKSIIDTRGIYKDKMGKNIYHI